jgi:hypothetical protein
MAFQGKFWLLYEEEPIDVDHGRVIALRDGKAFDGRTDAPCGTFVETPEGVDVTLDEQDGERSVLKFRMAGHGAAASDGAASPFDPEADGYSLTWSSVAFEDYRVANPIPEEESDEEEADRWEREEDLFPMLPAYGFAFRDGPRVYEMHEQNKTDAALNAVG